MHHPNAREVVSLKRKSHEVQRRNKITVIINSSSRSIRAMIRASRARRSALVTEDAGASEESTYRAVSAEVADGVAGHAVGRAV